MVCELAADGIDVAVAYRVLNVSRSGYYEWHDRPPSIGEEALFQPFQRLSTDRNDHHSGHGLGLAVVNAVARAHHAALTTTARPQGGLTVSVRFVPSPERASPQGAPGVTR